MANYINLETKQVSTEHEIRSAHPNTSFATPFSPDGYAVVFDAPQPTYDKYSETVQQGLPVLTSKGHWEKTWSIIQLEGDALIDAQAQKVEDEKAKIKSDIAALEATITPRRTREAILAIDTTWLADVELQIGQLRQQLAEL
jgi:hypothetical protein